MSYAIRPAAVAMLLLSCITIAADTEKEATISAPRVVRAAKKHLVAVRIFLKKDPTRSSRNVFNDESDGISFVISRILSALTEKKQSIDGCGVMTGKDTVLTGDIIVPDRIIDKIKIITCDGRSLNATVAGMIIHGGGTILRVETDSPLSPPKWVEKGRLEDAAAAVLLRYEGTRPIVSILPLRCGMYFLTDEAPVFFTATTGEQSFPYSLIMSGARQLANLLPEAAILVDKKGGFIGLTGVGVMDPKQETSPWKADRLLGKNNSISRKAFSALKERIRKSTGKAIFRVKLVIRKGKESSRFSFHGASGEGRDVEWYGVAYDSSHLLVPHLLTRSAAAEVDKILVYDGKTEVAADFVGAFREIGAFVVKRRKGKFETPLHMKKAPLPKELELFVAATVSRKMGEDHWEMTPNRITGTLKGYKNESVPQLLVPTPEGSLAFDMEGNLRGLTCKRVTGMEDLRGMLMSSFSLSSFGGSDTALYSMEKILSYLSNPKKHFDPTVKVLKEEEAKRLPWIGIEFSGITPQLAKAMKVEKPTKDGTVGLVVTHVYRGSPAEKMGISEGDILLGILPEGETDYVDLSAGRSFRWNWDFGEYGPEREFDVQSRRFRRPWKSRCNYLTMLLKGIGIGKKAKIKFFHSGKVMEKTFQITLAPPDFTSAPRYKNESLGLTVKNVTYEVRKALLLPPDAPGVVVSHVEEGTPAAVAKILPYELITKVDGHPVYSIDDFKKLAEKAAGERKRVKVTVFSLGKTRIAEMNLNLVKKR